jgi:hypothetical protein
VFAGVRQSLDPATLAGAAIAAALPYLISFGKEALKEGAGAAGKGISQHRRMR